MDNKEVIMNVYDQARILSKAISDGPEYKEYARLKQEVSKNDDLSAMVNDFHSKQMELQAKQMMGQELDEEALKGIQELYQVAAKDPLVAQYFQAEMVFMRMVEDVYKILGEVVKVD